jgi:2-polyprenyl-3-methyl-5-hydroxy-6-metoxy-1,4-benzoquinol methylase
MIQSTGTNNTNRYRILYIVIMIIVFIVALYILNTNYNNNCEYTDFQYFPTTQIKQLQPRLSQHELDNERQIRKNQLQQALEQCKQQNEHGPTPDGFWCMTQQEALERQNFVCGSLIHYAIQHLFIGQTVGDFGASAGYYTKRMIESGKVKHAQAYDGTPNMNQLTNGFVHHFDLSVLNNDYETIPVYDWILTLEVGEHVPKQKEFNFIHNVVSRARYGIVLSWAVPGQAGVGHYNNQPNVYVQARIQEYGFVLDAVETEKMRSLPDLFEYFRNTLMVFRRIVPL